MTRFQPNIKGYFLLGLFFLLFVGIPASFVIMLMTTPTMILGAVAGNFLAMIILLIFIFAVGLIIMGWFIMRFVRGNKFG